MKLELTADGFKKEGKPFFLISGEMHYFRVKKKDWPKHLEKAKAASLDAITTYVPWSWHEYKEGEFDLEGKTTPEKDIVGFIDLCGQMGLKINVKPGPYILAEYQDQGIPRWFLQKYPDVQVKDSNGRINIPFVCSYMHPTFLEYSAKWYDRIIPVIKDRQTTNNGPVMMMQVCNEVGLQQWLYGTGDYNPATLKYYYQYLENKHKSIQTLNELYKKSYTSFGEVIPPVGNIENLQDVARYRDWHEFHRWYYQVYIEYLIKDLKKRGIQIPFYHNVPGWVFSRAMEFPVCATLYSKAAPGNPELLLGLDHIPENVDFRNFHDASIISEMVKSLQGRKMPLFSAEFQAGSREHCVRTYPNELELFYKSALACGTQGWNYYMFSQGKNPPGEGVYGPTFYWDLPLDVKGRETPLYDTVSQINRWIKANEADLVLSKRKSDVGVAFYKPYYETEFYYPLFAKDKYFRTEKAGLLYDWKWVRDGYYFEGLLKVLHILNHNPELPDLEIQTVEELLQYKLLWVLCTEMMDEKTQEKLLDFLSKGGKAVFYPSLPRMDMEGRPCEILKKGLGVVQGAVITPVETKVKYFDLEPVSSFPVMQEYKVNGETVVAKIDRKVCGIEKTIGKGRATILGTIPNYQIEEHLDVFEFFLKRDGIVPQVISSERDVLATLRKGGQGSLLFVLNFHPVDKETILEISDNKKTMRLPGERKLTVPATTGLILPIQWRLPEAFGGEILYSTSELLGQSMEGQNLKLVLKGYQGTKGEIVIKSQRVPKRIVLNRKEIHWDKLNDGFKVSYRHLAKEFCLEVIS